MLKKTLIALVLLLTLALCCCAPHLPANPQDTTPATDQTDPVPSENGDSQPSADQSTTPVGSESTPDDTPSAEATPPLADNMLGIVWGGTTEYSVVRGEFSDTTVQQAASLVYNTINKTTGARLGIKTDWVKDVTTLDHAAPEIIFGETNRNASKDANTALADMTFSIRVVGNQVLITGSTDRLVALAADYFIKEYLSNPEYCSTGKCVLPRDLNVVQGPFEMEMVDLINNKDSYFTKQKQVLVVPRVNEFRIMQGGCTDGKYCYFAMNNNDVNAIICKYDMKTWKLVKRSLSLPIDHSNDICYNPDTGKLIVVHNAPNRNKISIVDPDTLTIDKTMTIGHQIFSMSYNQSRKQYVIGLSGGQNFAILDENFQNPKIYHVKSTGYTTQGVECDDDFIYFVQYNQNVIMIYNWSGKLVTRVDLGISLSEEPENISLVDNKFIIACNNSSWTGGVVYEVEIAKKN